MLELFWCTLILVYFNTLLPTCHTAPCLDVVENNQCHIYGDTCYRERRDIFNCKNEDVYHCAWDNINKHLTEACAKPVTCDIGKEPWIIKSANGVAKIECHYCHDQGYYNPYHRENSSKYSKCEVKKDDCTSTKKFMCELKDETDRYTKNVRCRCDVRNGYKIDKSYPENEPACSYEHGLSCDKAWCYPEEDVLMIDPDETAPAGAVSSGSSLCTGYQCAPKCPGGRNRSEYSDRCPEVSTPTPSQTPRPVSPIPSSAASLPSVKTKQTTTAKIPTTTTTTTRPSLTTTKGSSTTTSSQSQWIVAAVAVAAVAVIGFLVGGCVCILYRKNGGMYCACCGSENRDINSGPCYGRSQCDHHTDDGAVLPSEARRSQLVLSSGMCTLSERDRSHKCQECSTTRVERSENVPHRSIQTDNESDIHDETAFGADRSNGETGVTAQEVKIQDETTSGVDRSSVQHITHNYHGPVTIVRHGNVRVGPNQSEENEETSSTDQSDEEHSKESSPLIPPEGGLCPSVSPPERHLQNSASSLNSNRDSRTNSLRDRRKATANKKLMEKNRSTGEKFTKSQRSIEQDGTDTKVNYDQQQDRSQSLSLSDRSANEIRQSVKRRLSKSYTDFGCSKTRMKPFSDSVPVHSHADLHEDIKYGFLGMALNGCYTHLRDHLWPMELCDSFQEKGLFLKSVIRDMRQEKNDSCRNRAIIENVESSGWDVYIEFKKSLNETGQGVIVKRLQAKEMALLEGMAQCVLRCVCTKNNLNDLIDCLKKSRVSVGSDLEKTQISNVCDEGKEDIGDIVGQCDWAVYSTYKQHLKETNQQRIVNQIEDLERNYYEEMQTRTFEKSVPISNDTEEQIPSPAEHSAPEGSPSKPIVDNNDVGAHVDGSTFKSPDGPVVGETYNEKEQGKDLSQPQQQEKFAENQLNELARCKTFEDFTSLSERKKDPILHIPDNINYEKLGKKEYSNCPEGFQAYHTSGSQNSCLYQSVSCLLFGDENSYKTLRLKAALYAGRKWEKINKEWKQELQDRQKDEVLSCLLSMADNSIWQPNVEWSNEELIDNFMTRFIMETAKLGCDSCQVHVYFLSRALDRSIISYSQRSGDNLADQIVDGDNDPLHIMWVHSNNDPNEAPNHIVPLIRIPQ